MCHWKKTENISLRIQTGKRQKTEDPSQDKCSSSKQSNNLTLLSVLDVATDCLVTQINI